MKKKKSKPIYRRMVSLPQELEDAMRRYTGKVNWSKVARLAFEQKLSELDPKKLLRELEAEVERLKEKIAKQEAKQMKSGTHE